MSASGLFVDIEANLFVLGKLLLIRTFKCKSYWESGQSEVVGSGWRSHAFIDLLD
jgi:hypothetical protein